MWIAISQRNSDERDVLENNYVKYFENFGFRIIPIPNVSNDIESYFDKTPIGLIVLTGGGGISPEYGGKSNEKEISLLRDKTEKKLLEIAIRRKIPILGICRGMQFINAFFDGKITDIKKETDSKLEHVATSHEIKISNPKLSELLGKNVIKVNSYHNLGLTNDSLSSKLTPFAVSNDGLIEGFYHKKYRIVGVMWHPERLSPDKEANKKIIKFFIGSK
jgi:putative glutamine amidotransferase